MKRLGELAGIDHGEDLLQRQKLELDLFALIQVLLVDNWVGLFGGTNPMSHVPMKGYCLPAPAVG